jgi:hypothetical protein
MTALLMVFMAALVAFAVDLGYVFTVQSEMQRAADAAALAAAWEMVGDDRVTGYIDQGHDPARQRARQFVALNELSSTQPELDFNRSNERRGDIVLGYLSANDPDEQMSFMEPSRYNTVLVRLRCDRERNSPVPLFFARVLGFRSVDLSAEAAATFRDNTTVGFRVTPHTGNAGLMPFAVRKDDFEALLAGNGTDDWSYNRQTGEVEAGSDGICELSIFPQKNGGNGNGNGKGKGKNNGNGGGITPGNFGTVDIGNTNNSTVDLKRQIREGVSAEDLAPYDGELRLDPVTGKLELNGDTGISASIKEALAEIVGDPRTILLYEDVWGQGNNTYFSIVGFAGVRVVDFSLTGNDKYVLVQPAMVIDDAAISGDDPDSSYFVSQPVHLIRSAHLVQ